MEEKKRFAAVKRVSLAGLSEQWDEECYAYVVPSTYVDQQAILMERASEKSASEQIDFQVSFVRDRFISGKIKVFDGEQFTLVPMGADDTAASVEVCDHLYSAIMGFELDPKDIRKAAAGSALPNTEENTTETISSAALVRFRQMSLSKSCCSGTWSGCTCPTIKL